MPLRVVLDTHVVVSALIFSDGRLGWLRAAWRTGRIRPLISQSVARELIRVLEYPKFSLEPLEREKLLGEYLPACEVVRVPGKSRALPACRDPKDRMFLELALAGRADLLVTGNADLLDLAESFSIPIVKAESLRVRISLSLTEPAAPRYVPAALVVKKVSGGLSKPRAKAAR
ncbi:MAG TPA: putative toxin-antitoxin system toxin component, PIN family [Usitatibacter sp.]|nr:putative toxin-antitoxin system toxin component, PIN family [Usitatibacter sp.]